MVKKVLVTETGIWSVVGLLGTDILTVNGYSVSYRSLGMVDSECLVKAGF